MEPIQSKPLVGGIGASVGKMHKRSLALEPRILLDAAAVDTAVQMASDAVVDYSSPPDQGTHAGRELLFVDGAVSNLSQLLQGVDLQRYDVFVLDSQRDGLDQIADILASQTDISAIHIVSHGADGAIQLGNLTLTTQNLETEREQLGRIGAFLPSAGDILLYGCDVAASDVGRTFVDQLSGLIGRDVAASEDTTGLTGDWVLEYQHGTVEAGAIATLGDYPGDLALAGAYAGTELGTAGQTYERGWAVDASGGWLVTGTYDGGLNGEVKVVAFAGTTRITYTLPTPVGATASFGRGVAIDAEGSGSPTMVIADPNAGTSGKLFIYQVDASIVDGSNPWVLRQTVDVNGVASWGTSRIGPLNNGYALSQYISVDEKHIVVGAPTEGSGTGRVLWLADTSGTWSSYNSGFFEEPETADNGTAANFGASVSVAQDYLVISSPNLDLNTGDGGYGEPGEAGNNGRVYVYDWGVSSTAAPVRNLSLGASAADFLAGNPDADGTLNQGNAAADNRVGSAVDMEYYGGKYTIVVGAPGETSSQGEVYIYQTTNASMSTLQAASNIYGQTTGLAADRFASAVSVSQGRILVGAYNHNAATDTAIWYYESPTNTWTGLNTNNPAGAGILVQTFRENSVPAIAPDGARNGASRMGFSLALAQGNVIMAGTPGYLNNSLRGAVDFFFVRTPVASADAFNINEDTGATNLDILVNDINTGEVSPYPSITILAGSYPSSIIPTWDNTARRLNVAVTPGAFDYLALGQTTVVKLTYRTTAQTGGFYTDGVVTLTVQGANDAPSYVAGSIANLSGNRRIDTNGDGTYETNGTGSYQILLGSFSDVDQGTTFSYTIDAATTSAAILSMVSVSPAGLISWNLTGSIPQNTTYNVGIKATDSPGGASVVGVIQFTVLRDDVRPEKTVSAPASLTWAEDSASSQPVVTWFTDDDTSNGYGADEALAYSITYSGPGSASGWLSIRSDTGLLSGTPVNDNVGTTTVTITVTDKYGQQISHTFNMIVTNVNDAPTAQFDIDPVLADQGQAFSFQVPGFATSGNRADDLFFDTDNPANTITYTAQLVDASGNVLRTLGASPSGAAAGNWLTFSGGTISPTGVTTGTATFGGTSSDAIGTLLRVRIIATDNGAPVMANNYDFTIQTFAPTIGIGGLNGAAASELGSSVSISRDGNFMVVGAPNEGEKGAVRIYYWNAGVWTATTAPTVTASAVTVDGVANVGAKAGDRFGQAVTLDYDGSRLLVGASGVDTNAATAGQEGAGLVYAYTRTGVGAAATWTLTATYAEVAANRKAGDGFGSSLAFYTEGTGAVAGAGDGNSFIVGSPFDSDVKPVSGKAFLVGWAATGVVNPTAANTITPVTDAGDTDTSYDFFGYSVAYDGNIAVIGSPYDTHDGKFMAGSVTVLGINTPGTATPTLGAGLRQKITLGTASNSGDMFGFSTDITLFDGLGGVANTLDSALLVVGTPGSDKLLDDHGAVYVYRVSNGLVASANRATALNVTPTAFTAFDGRSFQYYGWSVSVEVMKDNETTGSTRMLIGSQQTGDRTGAAYMYKYAAGAWGSGQRYVPSAGAGTVNGMMFGSALDMSSDPADTRWATGAPHAGATGYDGRVYTSVAAAASPLSLGTDPGGELVPMGVVPGGSSSSTASTSLMSMDGSSSASSTDSFELEPLSTTSSTSTEPEEVVSESFSDLLLMDVLMQDALAPADGTADCLADDACLAMGDGAAPVWAANGLTRQLRLLQSKRDLGVQSLLDSLDRLAS